MNKQVRSEVGQLRNENGELRGHVEKIMQELGLFLLVNNNVEYPEVVGILIVIQHIYAVV